MPEILNQLVLSSVKNKLRWRKPLRLLGKGPTVDVLLPCWGEELEVIADTIKACVASDYPPNRFRIFVLDDANSPQVKDLVRQIQTWASAISSVEIIYAARPKKTAWLKAANLNFGLELAGKSRPGEYVAVLDIDMIPEPAWLGAMVPHLLQDDQLGAVVPPQRYYNVPKGSNVLLHFDDIMDFFTIIQDSLQAAYCTGCGFLCRRTALDAVGGFPTESLHEDLMVSLLLRAKKWNIAFVQEDQQYGQRPLTFRGSTKQWIRWMAGAIDTTILLFSSHLQSLPAEQRRAGSVLVLSAFFTTIIVLLSTVGLLLTLFISGSGPYVLYQSPDQLRNLLSLACVSRFIAFLHTYCISRSTGFRIGCLTLPDLWLFPYRIQGLFVALRRYLGVPARFKSAGAELNESNPQGKPVFQRLKIVLWDSHAEVHLVYLLALLAGVWNVLPKPMTVWTVPSTIEAIGFPTSKSLSSVLYPPLIQLLYICCTQAFVPIGYALNPPEIVNRETLLDRDERGVAHPTSEARDLDRTAAMPGGWIPFSMVLGWYGYAAFAAWTW